MKSLIRYLALKFIRESMFHETAEDRDEIFRAINDGMRRAFWEDNSIGHLNFTVLQLVKNGKYFQPYHFLGKRLHPDAIMHADAAHAAVMEAMKDNELTEWRKDIIAREKGECFRCGSLPGHRDETCPECTNLDGTEK